jgi:predicted dehydrogenase
MATRDGMNYQPDMDATRAVVEPGEFVFAASHFDHGHIYGQIGGLVGAGATLKYVYDPDPTRYEGVLADHPACRAVESMDEILADEDVKLVTSAAIPNLRCGVGMQVMDAGKDYLTDKAPFTTLEQLAEAREKAASSGMKYGVCYSERLLQESGWHVGELIEQGAIGKVVQVICLAPHNLAAQTRPDWFFKKEGYGGILTDIGSHQFEQFLAYTGSSDATINFARVDNVNAPDYPEFEDFCEASLTMENGASCYCRLDWLNPAASRTWGDGRTFVLGTEGYIEARKYIDVGRETGGDLVFLVNNEVEEEIHCKGKVGYPFFGRFIRDCMDRTEHAQPQEHAFKAAELSMMAQQLADNNR